MVDDGMHRHAEDFGVDLLPEGGLAAAVGDRRAAEFDAQLAEHLDVVAEAEGDGSRVARYMSARVVPRCRPA